jgi:hypothetical protein
MPPLADRLGGLPPPPPALECRFRYRIARDGHERIVYVYERRRTNRADSQTLPNDTELPYAAWARARGAESRLAPTAEAAGASNDHEHANRAVRPGRCARSARRLAIDC